jgi:hypothetical protein
LRGRRWSPPVTPKDEPEPAKDARNKDYFAESFHRPASSSLGKGLVPDAGPLKSRSTPMPRTLIRYKTRPETTEENQRLIEDVFAELRLKSPEGLRYMTLRLADGGFVHFVETGNGDNPLPAMDAFRRFQSGVRERCIEPPQFSEATIVGNYRMLDER